jgi:hypothetical protein
MNTQESIDAAKLTDAHQQSSCGDGSRSSCKPSRMAYHAREDVVTTTVMSQLKNPAPLRRQEA